MTVNTARVAGCRHVTVFSTPQAGQGAFSAAAFAAHICGANKIMAIGRVQTVASMAFGLFDQPKSNNLVGPRNHLVAESVTTMVPELIADLPPLNRDNAYAAWRDYAQVILYDNREEMAGTSDAYEPEDLSVQGEDLDWWLARLRSYGTLFLGEEITVSFGDTASGKNHVLPTFCATVKTGRLSVHKYMNLVIWQRATRAGIRPLAEATVRISRLEGM